MCFFVARPRAVPGSGLIGATPTPTLETTSSPAAVRLGCRNVTVDSLASSLARPEPSGGVVGRVTSDPAYAAELLSTAIDELVLRTDLAAGPAGMPGEKLRQLLAERLARVAT